ncbi:unnamed protein product [Alopecurus aequalis]
MSDSSEAAAAATEGNGAARGADWEVVTLTASAYAAAPGGPAAPEEGTSKSGRGSSDAMLMSDHFVFPPSEHENLPVETALEEDVQEESTSVEDAGFRSAVGAAGSETVHYYETTAADEAEMKDGSLHAEDDGRGSDADDSQDKPDAPLDGKSRGSGGAPCQCWLKKHMSCLYDQAKENNALWSVVVAAAFVGLVILWRKDKLHVGCLKWRSSSAVR